MQSCFQGALDFFLLSFGFKVGRLQVGGEIFFSIVFAVESGHQTFHASFIGGGRGGAVEEDSFSFQPIGGPKVPCFYSFQITGGQGRIFFQFSLFLNVFPLSS